MSHQNRVDQNLTFRSCMTDAVHAARKAGSVGTKLLKLARSCTDTEQFLARCQAEEDWILSDEAGQMKEVELPKCWTQAKSDIKQGWNAGVDPKDVTSYHKLREKKGQINKANREKKNGTNGRGEGGTLQSKAAKDVVGVTTMEEALEQGLVVDMKSNMLVPDELMPLVRLLDSMSQHGRARAIKQFTDAAEHMISDEQASHAKGMRDRMNRASS